MYIRGIGEVRNARLTIGKNKQDKERPACSGGYHAGPFSVWGCVTTKVVCTACGKTLWRKQERRQASSKKLG